jgi:peptidoglycan-N-acetylglucosamine deacetylase
MTDYLHRNYMPYLIISLLIHLTTSCNDTKHEKPQTSSNNIKAAWADSVKNTANKGDKNIFDTKPFVYDTNKKYIYLTFDDGPQNGTAACFELCKKLNVKATFFMVANHANSPNLKKIVNEIKNNYPLTLLANHSTTHANGKYKYFYNHEYKALNDFMLAQNNLNVPYKIIRLPGNTSWVRTNQVRANKLTKPVCKLLDSVGYNVLGWDIEWSFNRKNANPVQSADKMVTIATNYLDLNNLNEKNHLVILTHDRMFRNANYIDSLSKFITTLQQNNSYIFETMDHYPNLKKLQ